MSFTIRDVAWTATVVALALAWLIDSRQQRALVQSRDARLEAVEKESSLLELAMINQQRLAKESAEQVMQTQLDQRQEILELRQLIKRSINDQRDWFELELDSRRILAISPATANGAAVTARTIRDAEAATGLDGRRLRHFLEPIRQLQPRNRSYGMQ